MNILLAVLLGIIQGITEFLPVSSSGHLVIAQSMIPGFSQPGVLFDVILHAGTLFAIFIYYRKVIRKLSRRYILLILIGSIPAAIFGYIFLNYVEGFFTNLKIVGFALLITALFNYATDKAKPIGTKISEKRSLFIGLAQAFALIPGISRSGATISVGTNLGIKRKKAAQFSFLLSVPAILGANFIQIVTHGGSGELALVTYLAGFFSALVAGYISIGIVLKLLIGRRFSIFAIYSAVLGIVLILI